MSRVIISSSVCLTLTKLGSLFVCSFAVAFQRGD